MNTRLEVDDFEKQLNQRVTFSNNEESFEATIKIVDCLSRQAEQSRQPFSVVFATARADVFEQKIYTLNHPVMGEQPIFLVPIGPDENGMCYEAVFS